MNDVLVVDDSLIQRTQISEIVSACGYNPVLATDGLEGLNLAGSHDKTLALIICDFNMPIMDGLTMCTKIRDLPLLKTIPIFMLTSEASREYRGLAISLKISAWIIKPLDPDMLKLAIKEVLKSAQT